MASITRRSSGWQVQIRKQGYRPISKRFDKKSEADAWARAIESEMDRNVFIDRSLAERTTLGEILIKYRDQVSINKLGYKQEKSRVNVLLSHSIADRYLATIKSSDFAEYREFRLSKVCGTTVNKELSLFGKVIDTARQDWSINMDNPVRSIRRPKNNRPRDRRLLIDELEKIISSTESPLLPEITLFALETAMRRGEIANAKWKHVSFNQRTMLVPETKTGVPRTIPLSKKAILVLQSIRNDNSEFIFNLRAGSISQAFERACNRAGINDLNFHDLRHEATSRLFEKGLNPMQVSAVTGHKTFEMLKRYTHLKAEDLASLLD